MQPKSQFLWSNQLLQSGYLLFFSIPGRWLLVKIPADQVLKHSDQPVWYQLTNQSPGSTDVLFDEEEEQLQRSTWYCAGWLEMLGEGEGARRNDVL